MKNSLLGLAIAVLVGGQVSAAIVFDSQGFEGYANGAIVGQAVGGFPAWEDLNSPNGNRFSVQDTFVPTGGAGKSIAVSQSSEVAGFVAPRVNYTPAAGEIVVIEVDIARTIAAFPFNPSSNGFNIDVYAPGTDFRTLGFGLGYDQQSHSIQAFVTRGDGSTGGLVDPIDLAIAQNTFVNFRAELDYAANTFRLFVNGTDTKGTMNFVNAASVLGDADIQHDSVVDALDNGYFDNYRISTVPEPGSALFGSVGLIGLLLRRRRS